MNLYLCRVFFPNFLHLLKLKVVGLAQIFIRVNFTVLFNQKFMKDEKITFYN